MIANRLSLPLLLLAALPACTSAHDPAASSEPTPHTDQADEPVDHVDIPPTVRRNLGITFAEVQVRNVAQTLRVPGAFEYQPRARRAYRMTLPGKVELLVDQYASVEAGTPLYRFQSPTWPELLHEIIQGEQAIDTAHAEIMVAKARRAEAASKLKLVRGRIAALAEADFKKADLEIQAASLEASLPTLDVEVEFAATRLANAERTRQHALHRAAAASGIPEEELEAEVPGATAEDGLEPRYLSIDWIEVRALQPGIVEMLAVTDGAFVEPPAMVLSTVNPEMLRFRALALQADLPKIPDPCVARIVPPPAPGVAMDAGVSAVMKVGLEAHPEERTVALIATPEELAPWARPGISAFLEITTQSTEAATFAIPRSCIVQDGLKHVFFRRAPDDPDEAIRVEADMGVSDGTWVALHSGVQRGDEVVLAGAYELKLATQQSGASSDGGHVHADGSVHDDH